MRVFEPLEANLRATLGSFRLAQPEGEIQEEPGLALVCSRVRYAMFNTAMLTSPVAGSAELAARLARAERYFACCGLPWSLWLCTGWLAPEVDAASSICSRYRLELITDLPAMQTDGLRPPVRPLPELRYRRVRDEESRAAFAHIMSVAFNVPYPISRQIYESESTWTGAMVGYVAFHGDRPVSTTVTVSAGGVEGVYAVGTLPLEQRRGYGEAVMRYALEQAGAAGRRSILQSSAAGFRLYERMGYRTVARYLVFAST